MRRGSTERKDLDTARWAKFLLSFPRIFMLLSQYSTYNFIWFDPLGSLTLQWVDNGETDTVPGYRPPKVISTHSSSARNRFCNHFPSKHIWGTFEGKTRWTNSFLQGPPKEISILNNEFVNCPEAHWNYMNLKVLCCLANLAVASGKQPGLLMNSLQWL